MRLLIGIWRYAEKPLSRWDDGTEHSVAGVFAIDGRRLLVELEIPENLKLSNVMLMLTTDHSAHNNEIRVSTLKHHLRRYTRRNTSNFL